MEQTESKFKWLEALDSVMLLEAIGPMTLEEKAELVSDILISENLNEVGLNNAVAIYSQITSELVRQLVELYGEVDTLRNEMIRRK